ncbi:MAG: exosortase system-associated protein, TIGR04073 family [Methylococcaceae bacterium]
MKKIALPVLLASLIMVITPTSFADQQQSYGSQVANKALNGFANMSTSVLEIPKNIINTTNESHIMYGLSGGIAEGVLHTVGRMMTGLTDLITAPLLTKPIVYPKYVWDDFDEDTTYGEVFRLQE